MTQRHDDQTSSSLKRRMIAKLRDLSGLRGPQFDNDLRVYLAGSEPRHAIATTLKMLDEAANIKHGVHGGISVIHHMLKGDIHDFDVPTNIREIIDQPEYKSHAHLIRYLFPERFETINVGCTAGKAPILSRRQVNPSAKP
jgi:gamma-glutamyltranspeptidase